MFSQDTLGSHDFSLLHEDVLSCKTIESCACLITSSLGCNYAIMPAATYLYS